MVMCLLVFSYYTQTSRNLTVYLEGDQLDKECSFAVLLQNICHGRNDTEIFI